MTREKPERVEPVCASSGAVPRTLVARQIVRLMQERAVKVAEMSLSTVVRYEPDAGEVVWLRGEHDRSTAAALSIVLARAIAAGDTDVVVDLSRVEFMDASTARVIAQARERLRVQSRLLFLRSPSRPAWRVVALCGLADSVVARALHPAVRGRSSWVREPGAA